MSEPTLKCPQCAYEIKLTEAMAAPLVESMRRDFEQRLAQKDAESVKRESKLREREEAIRKQEETLDDRVNEKVRLEKVRIADDEAKKARLALGDELEKYRKDLAEVQARETAKDAKLAAAQKAEAEFLRKQRELDDARREMDLNIEKRVQENLGKARDAAKKEAEESLRLKVLEKEQTIASLQRKLEEAIRKAEQGSQQLQGEVQELELESLLAEMFPHDTIEPVAKGVHGGDVVQRVVSPSGQSCGSILWESKRTRNWTEGWLAKVREDQRLARAEIAIIVTQALPKDIDNFDLRENVWVTSCACTAPVANIARQMIMEVSGARRASEGQRSKAELLYQYMSGPRFRDWINVILEKFQAMRDDLEKERRAMTASWRKREQHINAVIESTAGMYGDLQGIAGRTLKEIEGLDVKMLDGPGSET